MPRRNGFPDQVAFVVPERDGSGAVQGYRVVGGPMRPWQRSSSIEDDFLWGFQTPPWTSSIIGAGASIDSNLAFGTNDSPGLRGQGVMRGNTGTTNAGTVNIFTQNTIRNGRERLRLGFRLTTHELATVADDYYLACGFSDSVLGAGAPAANGCYFSYDRAGHGEFWVANYVALAAGITVTQVTAATRSANTFQVLEIDIDDATSRASFFVDGLCVAEINDGGGVWDNVVLLGCGIRKTNGVNSRAFLCDWMRFILDGQVDRG